jgi:twinkle protein
MSREIAKREQCPNCASLGRDTDKDNLAVYENGKYCQAGCGYMERDKAPAKEPVPGLIPGDLTGISSRGLTKDSCLKYNVRTAQFSGRLGGNALEAAEIVIFPFYENGRVVKQKIRSLEIKKAMSQFGETSNNSLFGENCFNPNKSIPIIVTEGEYDAIAMYQMTGLPCVSISTGCQGAFKQLSQKLDWLSGFKEVLLCFDMDEPGRAAIAECVTLFEPGTVRSVNLPYKDANEVLLAGKQDMVQKCIWNAEIIKPKTIIFPNDIREQVLQKPQYGTPWPWKFMTEVTYGNRLGEVYMLAGDTSVGKTQIIYQIISTHINNGCKVGLIDLERQNVQTLQRVISGMINKRIYLPDCDDFNIKEINDQLDKLQDSLVLYRPESGKLTIESILINIRYLCMAYKINFFVIDNLTALSTNTTHGNKDHEQASQTVGQLVQIAKELNVTIFIVNHLVKDPISLSADISMPEDYNYNAAKEGLTWETGRMPGVGHIYGGGKVAKLPDYLIVVARNRMSTDKDIQRTIRIKFLKTRMESSHEGEEFKLIYDVTSGQLVEPNF